MGPINSTFLHSMPAVRIRLLSALALSLGVHGGLLGLGKFQAPPPSSAAQETLQLELTLAPVQPVKPDRPAMPAPSDVEKHKPVRMPDTPAPTAPEKQPATMAAPPAPTAEDR